jgi:transcriptional regulator with XRE-family HTH domain
MKYQNSNDLDTSNLAKMLKERRGSLSLRQAALDAGVSFSTFTRVESGSQPDLVSFTKLCTWLGVSASDFFKPAIVRQISKVEEIVRQLRDDPALSSSASDQIANMVRELYSVLANPTEKPKGISCHLRAASMLRPGVSARLSEMLVDIESRLKDRANGL